MIVVVRPDGDPGIFINPRYGFTSEQAASILEAMAKRLREEAAGV